MFNNINQDVQVFQSCILHERCRVYRNGCKCKECTDIQSSPALTLESYILLKWKSEACTCKKCCWCVYKSYYDTEPTQTTHRMINSQKPSQESGNQQSRKSYDQMVLERQQNNIFALE